MFASSDIEEFIKQINGLQIKYLRNSDESIKRPSNDSVNTHSTLYQNDSRDIPLRDLIVADFNDKNELKGFKIRH